MEEWKTRVITEYHQLKEKKTALGNLLRSTTYEGMTMFEKGLIDTQFYHMSEYLNVLVRRIDVFKNK